MADSAALLVDEVLPHRPMRQWVFSVPFPLRFLFASRPAIMGKVLGIVYRAIATHLSRKAHTTKTTSHTGAVTLIQCFGSALNMNIHFHMLFLEPNALPVFLERQGLLERDAEHSTFALDAADEDPMDQLLGHSITYRIAVGPQQGRKVFTLQTLPACDPDDLFADTVGKTAGFSLHAGVAVKARQRDELERLCRYITRPAVSEKRLSL